MGLNGWTLIIEIVAAVVAAVVVGTLLRRRLPLVALLVGLWYAGALLLSRVGFFSYSAASGAQPEFVASDLLGFSLLGMLMAAPVAAGVIAWRRSERLRRVLGTIPASTVIAVQVYRLAGVIFYGLAALELLPRSMGAVTGTADLIVGATAPILAISLARAAGNQSDPSPALPGVVRLWSIFGIADFAMAIAFVSLAIFGLPVGTPDPVLIGEHPLALISLFQVPLSILLHLLAMRLVASHPVWQPRETVLVVGATTGIGRATAAHLADRGYTVYGTGRSVREDERMGAVRMLRLDICDTRSIEDALSRIPGGADIVINSAGSDLYGTGVDTTMEEFNYQLEVNLIGVARLARAVIPHMADQRRGTFVQLSSLGGLIALPHNSAYAAAKFGVEGYLESLRAELAPLGISVVLVEPGQVNTETLATTLLNARERRFAELLATVTGREESAYEHALTEGARAALTPEAVAREIARTLADPRPPLRNPIGRQARWIWFAKRILGYAGMERILTGMT